MNKAQVEGPQFEGVAIPKDWDYPRLGDLLNIEYGKALAKRERRDGIIPVVTSAGVTGSHDEAIGNGPALVIGRKGAAGRVTLVHGPFWATDTAFFAEVRSGTSAEYLALVLSRMSLERLDQSTALPSLSRDHLRNVRVPMPVKEQQDEIVYEVSREFDRINSIESELDEVDRLAVQFRSAVLRDAFTGRLGAEVHSAGSVFPIGVPKSWEVRELGDIAEVRSGITKNAKLASGDEVPYMSTANVQAGYLRLDNVKTILASKEQQEKHRLEVGDVLVLEGGDPDKVGRGWVWNGEIEGCLHQNHVFAVRPGTEFILPEYLAHFVNSPQARIAFLARAKQTTGIASINRTQLRELPIPLPGVDEQYAIVEAIKAANSAIGVAADDARVAREGLKKARSSVLHQAFTGGLV